MRKSIAQFMKFGIVGISNTAISLVVYYVLLWAGIVYWIANTISWIISVFNAFYWNNCYVFKNDTHWRKTLVKTYISYGASFIAGFIFLIFFVEICNVSDKIAPLFSLVLSIPLNFIMNKYWTFK